MLARWLVPLLVALCALAVPEPAPGAPGDLIGQSCISKAGTDGCALLPQPNMLEFANGIVVAPDGTDVYVGAGAGVAHFRRAADGSLTYANCVDTDSSLGSRCPAAAPPDASGALSANAIKLAISPDGKHVYAISWTDALLWWTRDPVSGDLTWGGCRDGAAASATNGRCGTATTFAGGNFPAGSMDFTQGIAVTPDGQTIYIADQSGGLLQAQRNPTTGAATPTACFDTTGSAAAGCTAMAADVPLSLSGIGVASNSRDIYVNGISTGGISHFRRSVAGVTSFAGCVAHLSSTASCATAAPSPVFTWSGSLGVAGDAVYAYGGNYGTPSGTISRFGRAADGSLTFQRCATTEVSPGPCASLPALTAGGSIGRLAVSPDQSSVYLPPGGTTERALTRLTGSLDFASCLSETGVAACSPAPLPVPFGQPVGQMALSPDGRQLYQTAGDTLNVFQIAGPSPESSPIPISAHGRRVATKPKIRSLKRDRKGRYRVRIEVFEAGIVKARFTGKLKRKGKVRTLGKVATKRVSKPSVVVLVVTPSAVARERKLKAKLVVGISAPEYLSAETRRTVKLK